MALLDRQLMKMRKRDDIHVVIHQTFSELYRLAKEIVIRANSDDGKETVFIFGIDQETNLIGIKGNEKEITNQMNTFMGIFKPLINYKIKTSYNPSDYKIIYYLHIYPNIKRLFFPHFIRKGFDSILSHKNMTDFSESLQKMIEDQSAREVISINNLINFFSPIHIEQFENYKDETITQKINRIVDTIHFFENRMDLIRAMEKIDLIPLFNNIGILALKCSIRIMGFLELHDELSKQVVISRMIHLFDLLPEGRVEFESHLIYFIRDIIIEDCNPFGLNIETFDDLNIFLYITSAVGITVHLDRVLKEIELVGHVQKLVKSVKKKKMEIFDDDLLARIFIIFLPYIEDKKSNVKSIFNRNQSKIKKQNKSKLKKEIEHRDRIIRSINKKGRNERDNRLALLVKEYYGYECQSCDSKKSKLTTITVSHNIPLFFGVSYGGIDRSVNMTVLCRFCHDLYEKNFEEKIFNNLEIVSKEDLLKYLKNNYPENFD